MRMTRLFLLRGFSIDNPHISYAQNAEDIVLWRAFSEQKTGFYVDIGAASPVRYSVTKLFYDKGWNGINVEPIKQLHEKLVAQRPKDINLQLALGAKENNAKLYIFPTHQTRTTTDKRVATTLINRGLPIEEDNVQMKTLNLVLEQHCKQQIDFLKIDTEGTEADVLASFDLLKWQPRVIVIEAVKPGTKTPSYQQWEPKIINNGYKMALFDSVNRFYVRSNESESFIKRLSKRANDSDNFETAAINKLIPEPLT